MTMRFFTIVQRIFLTAKTTVVLLLSTLMCSAQQQQHHDENAAEDREGPLLRWRFRSPLPSPRSGLSATLVGEEVDIKNSQSGTGSTLFLMGGCSSPTYSRKPSGTGVDNNDRDGRRGIFDYECTEVADDVWRYDSSTTGPDDDGEGYHDHYQQMSPMKGGGRLRHTATYVYDAWGGGGAIWVIGGRNVHDRAISAIDVYDIASDTWKTFGYYLPLSDHASVVVHFGEQTNQALCILGGWNQDYEVHRNVPCIDVRRTYANVFRGGCPGEHCISWFRHSDEPRIAALTEYKSSAQLSISTLGQRQPTQALFVVGGVTEPCGSTLGTTQVYNIERDEWSVGRSLPQSIGGREVTSVAVGERLFAIGSEQENGCSTNDRLTDSSGGSVAMLDMNMNSPAAQWRSATVAGPLFTSGAGIAPCPASESILAFGGSSPYSADCDCYHTMDRVASLSVKEFATGSFRGASPTALEADQDAAAALAATGASGQQCRGRYCTALRPDALHPERVFGLALLFATVSLTWFCSRLARKWADETDKK